MFSSMAKLYAEEMVIRTAEKALRIHGGVGYTEALPVEEAFQGLPVLPFRGRDGRDPKACHFQKALGEVTK